jgi:hypothetical protein
VRSDALPCKIPSAVGVAGGRRYRQNIERQGHAVVPSSDRNQDKIGLQNGCFPTCMSSTNASREILLVCCCVPASVLRAKRRCSTRRALLRLGAQTAPNFVLSGALLPPSRPRFARLTCAAGQSRSARKRVSFDGCEHDGRYNACCSDNRQKLFTRRHIVVVQSGLVPQSSNLFVRLCKGIRSPLSRSRVTAPRRGLPHVLCEAGGSREISAVDGKIKRDSSLPELRS